MQACLVVSSIASIQHDHDSYLLSSAPADADPAPPQTVEELVTEKRQVPQQGGEPKWVRSTSVLMNETKTTEWSLADGSGAEMPIELNGGDWLLSRVMQHGGDRL